MKAVVYDTYGAPDVLRLEEVQRPVPKDDEVLVKIRAVAVTRADCATREANRRSGLAVSLISRLISGLSRPKQRILGTEFAGEVAALGAAAYGCTRIFGTGALGPVLVSLMGISLVAAAVGRRSRQGSPVPAS